VRLRVPTTFVVVNDCEALSQRLRQVSQGTFHFYLRLLTPTLGQQLPLRFEPIGFRVAGQSKSASAFGNEISPEANDVV
jgi:hypothetical protein